MRSTPKMVTNLVLFIVLVVAVMHTLGVYGLALPFIYPVGMEPK